MEYCEFLENIQNRTKSIAGEGGKVTVNHILKNNGKELDGLTIMEEDSCISPTIYLNDYYEQYENGRGLDNILSEIRLIYMQNKDRIKINTDLFYDFLKVRSMIVYRVINYEQNRKLA